MGRNPEALAQIDIAQQLEPASTAIVADKGLILLFAGPREQGVALLKQLEATEPAFPSTYRYLQHAYLMDEDYPAYLAAWEKAVQLTHEETELAVQVQLLNAGVLTVDEVRAMRGLGPFVESPGGNSEGTGGRPPALASSSRE